MLCRRKVLISKTDKIKQKKTKNKRREKEGESERKKKGIHITPQNPVRHLREKL